MKFYRKNARLLTRELKLKEDLHPFHWTDYSFYNGGPTRWLLIKRYLQMRQSKHTIPANLAHAVKITKRRNMTAQKIGKKNDYLRSLVYDSTDGKLVENDGLLRYGLYDFAGSYEHREFLHNLDFERFQNNDVDTVSASTLGR